ncbi:hypothetical protein G7Y89_g8152 [Cudoniella acicularis]|uniref:F-box domain-containing protein n=1 Tax=Cudoniella acicularis TaxID=354080 RepID=A0A8H4RH58_9HELO|nr:hypothetical protein G7Y89_g8152 [Cudoniella acicularis]
MDLLPTEIILQIASYLDPTNLAAFLRISRRYFNDLQDKLYDLALTYVMPYDLPILHWAAWNIPNRGKTFYALKQKGADIHVLDYSENTLLHILCLSGDKDEVELVVQSGLHPGTRNGYGVAPLVNAAGSGRVEVVQYMLCEAFDVWKQNAAKNATIVEAGDSQNIPRDTDLRTLHESLCFAAEGGHASVVKLLCQYVDVSQPCLLDCSFTESAVKGGSVDVLQTLIENGAKLSPRLLRIAAGNGRRELVHEILRWQTTDISAQDDDSGYTALHEAAGGGHADIVETLLHHGANPNTKTKMGSIAWDLADSKIIMDILEQWGADIAMPDRDWWDWWDDYIDGGSRVRQRREEGAGIHLFQLPHEIGNNACENSTMSAFRLTEAEKKVENALRDWSNDMVEVKVYYFEVEAVGAKSSSCFQRGKLYTLRLCQVEDAGGNKSVRFGLWGLDAASQSYHGYTTGWMSNDRQPGTLIALLERGIRIQLRITIVLGRQLRDLNNGLTTRVEGFANFWIGDGPEPPRDSYGLPLGYLDPAHPDFLEHRYWYVREREKKITEEDEWCGGL